MNSRRLAVEFRSSALGLWAAVSTLAFVSTAQGGLLLSPSSDAVDPSQISVGDTIHIKLSLDGLLTGTELVSLSQRFEIDPAIFEVIQVSPGSIFPNPLDDPLDLTLLSGAGFADATFLTLSSESAKHITSNGLFFEIELKALSAGTATGEIVFVDALQIDPLDPQNLITPDLQVGAALVLHVVPESSSWALAVGGIAAIACSRRFLSP